MGEKHKVVILGGGFGGLVAAQALKRADAQVTLIDKRNFHLFQPLLYQVATGSLSPGEIAAPLRAVLSRQKNTQVLLGEAVDIDPDARRVILRGLADFLLRPGSVARLGAEPEDRRRSYFHPPQVVVRVRKSGTLCDRRGGALLAQLRGCWRGRDRVGACGSACGDCAGDASP